MGKENKKDRKTVKELYKRLNKLEKSLKKRKRHDSSDRHYHSRSRSRSPYEQTHRCRTRTGSSSHSHSTNKRMSRRRSRSRSERNHSLSRRTPHRRTLRSITPNRHLVSSSSSVSDRSISPKQKKIQNEKGGADEEEMVILPSEPINLPANIEQVLGQDGAPCTNNSIMLHEGICKRWTSIIENGLNTEVKQNIIKKYDPPTNCALLTPPKLNEEVAAAINESGMKRDQRICLQQSVLASAISAVGKSINNIIETEDVTNIEILSDAGRLLCDLLHQNSITRRSLILPGLNKDMKELMEKTPISEYLFGDKLQEKVNTCKAVKKSAQELKNTQAKTFKPKMPLNYRGPQRLQAPRPSGPKPTMKRATFQPITATRGRFRRSPQRQPPQPPQSHRQIPRRR